MKKDYEITFILSNQEKIYSDSLATIKEIFSEFDIEENGFKDLGVKTFYFPIKKNSAGRYVSFYIKVNPENVDKLSKRLKIEDHILRYIIVSLEEKDLAYLKEVDRKRDRSF